MRLLFILLPLLSFAATSVLAGEQIGADPDGNPIYANNDGKLIFCDKPNYGGACSAETIFMVEQCYHIPDPDTKGGPGSSWRVLDEGAQCKLYTGKYKCDGSSTKDWAYNALNNLDKKTYQTFKCQANTKARIDKIWPQYNRLMAEGS